MTDAIQSVVTGEVTRAVRDTSSAAGTVVTGDWIGIVRGDGIVAISGSLEGAATSLLEHLVTPASEIVTIITGADATAVQTAALVSWLGNERSSAEVEVHHGGQPLYPFLIGVE
jgi:dihydroxyacetone kinase-like predicted kinase